jgi:hypothetical protein
MRAVLETRGRLGFNAKYLIHMGEEIGSPGLREICMDNCELFSGDLFHGVRWTKAINSEANRLSRRARWPFD